MRPDQRRFARFIRWHLQACANRNNIAPSMPSSQWNTEMSDPKPSDIPPANETFSETYSRLAKEAYESDISKPEAAFFYLLVGSLYALAVRLIGRLVHRSP